MDETGTGARGAPAGGVPATDPSPAAGLGAVPRDAAGDRPAPAM